MVGFRGYVGNMDWQQTVSLVIVAGAAVMLAGGKLRRRKVSWDRDTHCGCSAATTSAMRGSIIYRARKGERPQVVVRMK